MERGGGREESRPTVYCIVPRDLAPRLHQLLRRHFRDEPRIQVVVERRTAERRATRDRRASDAEPVEERRAIPERAGRRVDERRAARLAVDAPRLPRLARPHADRISFVKRIEPAPERALDIDSRRLVRRVQSGDDAAFAELYMRYFERVYGYLRVALQDSHEAEDATQQVFIKVFEALPRYRSERAPFRAWLFTIVRNHAISELQKRSRVDLLEVAEIERRSEPEPPDEDLLALRWISDDDLLMLIERLPLRQRQVLTLRYMLDLSHAQVAAVLGLEPANVRNLQSRALKFMRERLIALGRAPSRRRIRMVGCIRKAPVLRTRRFALID